MKFINVSISVAVLVCLVFVGCQKEEGNLSGGKPLTVGVVMAESPDAKSVTKAAQIVSDTISLEGDCVFVATSEPRGYEQPADGEVITRGTPMSGAGNITAIGINVFNSGTGSFSNSTPLERTLSAKSSGGSWTVTPTFALKEDTNYTYVAFTPEVSGSNGVSVTSDGRKINYTAPTTVADQPDLCTSTFVKDYKENTVSFAMSHRLVAVGIKAMGNWVKINSVTISNVYSSGTLDLESGAWSDLGSKSTFSPGLVNTNLSTNGSMNDITAANGYLMLPPQAFTDDDQTVSVNYTYLYDGASPDPVVSTFKLKDLTGGKWSAGQIVTYNIQLKSYFSVTFTPTSLTLNASGGIGAFKYSTDSPSYYDPQFSNGGTSWISNINVDRHNRIVTFNYVANTSTTVRQAVIKAVSGYTNVDYTVKQGAYPSLTISSSAPGETVPSAGKSYYATVTSNTTWSVSGSNTTITPASGGIGTTNVTITVSSNSISSNRTVSANFATTTNYGQSAVSRSWSGTQDGGIPAGCFTTPIPGYSNVYVALTNQAGTMNQSAAARSCQSWGGRLPSSKELRAIYNNRSMYGSFNGSYWTWEIEIFGSGNFEYECGLLIDFNDGQDVVAMPSAGKSVRCVKYK